MKLSSRPWRSSGIADHRVHHGGNSPAARFRVAPPKMRQQAETIPHYFRIRLNVGLNGRSADRSKRGSLPRMARPDAGRRRYAPRPDPRRGQKNVGDRSPTPQSRIGPGSFISGRGGDSLPAVQADIRMRGVAIWRGYTEKKGFPYSRPSWPGPFGPARNRSVEWRRNGPANGAWPLTKFVNLYSLSSIRDVR